MKRLVVAFAHTIASREDVRVEIDNDVAFVVLDIPSN